MTFAEHLEKHHHLIIGVLAFMLVFFVWSCMLHDVIPICHWLLGYDHGMHVTSTAM